MVFSKNLDSHLDHFGQGFLLCRELGLTIGLPKCEVAVDKIEFLGHIFSTSGCSPLQKHTTAISEFPPPSDKPALQRFLGVINFYRKFIRGAARTLAPLTDALVADALSRPVPSSAPGPIKPGSNPGSNPSSSFARASLKPCSEPSSNLSCFSVSKKIKPVSLPCTPVLDDSPLPAPEISVPEFDFSKIPSHMQSCTSISNMKNSSSLSVISIPYNSESLLYDDSTGGSQTSGTRNPP